MSLNVKRNTRVVCKWGILPSHSLACLFMSSEVLESQWASVFFCLFNKLTFVDIICSDHGSQIIARFKGTKYDSF